jgi:hypothetical protein
VFAQIDGDRRERHNVVCSLLKSLGVVVGPDKQLVPCTDVNEHRNDWILLSYRLYSSFGTLLFLGNERWTWTIHKIMFCPNCNGTERVREKVTPELIQEFNLKLMDVDGKMVVVNKVNPTKCKITSFT